MKTSDNLQDACQDLTNVLVDADLRIVFAESCTAGLVAATLARSPGISRYLCGSAVVYREATKSGWLDVDEALISLATAVSQEVAIAMATGVLRKTPEARFSASVTGHLGPDAPSGLDGVVYISVAKRENDRVAMVDTRRHVLITHSRLDRQRESALLVLRHLQATIASDLA